MIPHFKIHKDSWLYPQNVVLTIVRQFPNNRLTYNVRACSPIRYTNHDPPATPIHVCDEILCHNEKLTSKKGSLARKLRIRLSTLRITGTLCSTN